MSRESCLITHGGDNIRICHECEGRIEKSVPRITVWHHEACRVMTNGDPEGRSVMSRESCLITHGGDNIRICHKCEGRIEKSVPRITVWHHEACRVMTNGDPEGRIFSILPSHE